MKNFPQHCPYKKLRTEGTDHSMTIPTKGKRWCSWAVCFSLSETLLFFIPFLIKLREALGSPWRRKVLKKTFPWHNLRTGKWTGYRPCCILNWALYYIIVLSGVGLRLSWARAFTLLSFLLTRTMCSLSILNALFGMTIDVTLTVIPVCIPFFSCSWQPWTLLGSSCL